MTNLLRIRKSFRWTALDFAIRPRRISADDFALVTVSQAYLLDDDGSVGEIVPFFTVLDVQAEEGNRLRIARGDQTLWLHKWFVHRGSQFSELKENERAALRNVFNSLEKSARKGDAQRHEEAIAHTQKAAESYSATNNIPFPLLADPDQKVFSAYRCVDDFEKQPLHGTVLIDAAGQSRWQDIGAEPFTNAKFLLEEAQRLLRLPTS